MMHLMHLMHLLHLMAWVRALVTQGGRAVINAVINIINADITIINAVIKIINAVLPISLVVARLHVGHIGCRGHRRR